MLESYSMFSSVLNHDRNILIYVKESPGATDYQLTDVYQEYV